MPTILEYWFGWSRFNCPFSHSDWMQRQKDPKTTYSPLTIRARWFYLGSIWWRSHWLQLALASLDRIWTTSFAPSWMQETALAFDPNFCLYWPKPAGGWFSLDILHVSIFISSSLFFELLCIETKVAIYLMYLLNRSSWAYWSFLPLSSSFIVIWFCCSVATPPGFSHNPQKFNWRRFVLFCHVECFCS